MLFEWKAREYRDKSQAQVVWANEVIEKLALQPDEHVLDIGCGDGKLTARIAELVPEGTAVGIDNSGDMVQFASSEYRHLAPRLRFKRMDASALSFANVFDAVFSNAVLHWVKEHGPVLAGIGRGLRNGGRVCMQFGGRGNAAEVRSVVDEVRSRPPWSAYFRDFEFPYHFYGPDEYSEWLKCAGLRPGTIELVARPMRHTPDQFEGWFTTTWMPYTTRVPGPMKLRFVAEVVNRFIDLYPPDSGGVLTVPMMRLNVEAYKPQ